MPATKENNKTHVEHACALSLPLLLHTAHYCQTAATSASITESYKSPEQEQGTGMGPRQIQRHGNSGLCPCPCQWSRPRHVAHELRMIKVVTLTPPGYQLI